MRAARVRVRLKKHSINCDEHPAESLFQTRSNMNGILYIFYK